MGRGEFYRELTLSRAQRRQRARRRRGRRGAERMAASRQTFVVHARCGSAPPFGHVLHRGVFGLTPVRVGHRGGLGRKLACRAGSSRAGGQRVEGRRIRRRQGAPWRRRRARRAERAVRSRARRARPRWRRPNPGRRAIGDITTAPARHDGHAWHQSTRPDPGRCETRSGTERGEAGILGPSRSRRTRSGTS